MKTNNVMVRPMGDFQVQQRTKDGMFNATALIAQWNAASGQKKALAHYFENANTTEFIKAIEEEEHFTCRNSVYVKSKARADRGGGTWMHPLLFIDFAMWLNPSFKVKVIKFVYDEMIKYRNEAGDAYKQLSAAVATLVEKPFMAGAMSTISKAINFCVFGDHHKMIRNERGDEKLQRSLFELERKVADLITDGFLKDFDQVMNYLRMTWKRKFKVS